MTAFKLCFFQFAISCGPPPWQQQKLLQQRQQQ
eukprot:CAMPEP_0197575810 /NCGR_PEP_ID=MMETSP1326-20131121/1070_1 /TAXON_ID=1155430 /ORGANISM="Genus nov. species nov., Strain RCC2288" /LENGTH=32 /DNA_ID= /DNA_START= /DNA_END= /DNA_ORIENTATION=